MATYPSLSLEQKYAFERFRQGNNIFITGPGGTGKSYFIQFLSQWAEEHGRSLSVCAMTGCAAVLLGCNAKTIHSWSGVRLARGTKQEVVAMVSRNRTAVKTWKKTSILVLDEVSMLSARLLEILDAVGKCVRKNLAPFGGIQLVFSGDFYQLPPVPEQVGAGAGETETQFCFESPLWKRIFPIENTIELTTLFRQKDAEYIQMLMEIRKGTISPENAKKLVEYTNRAWNAEETNGCVPTKLFPVRSKVDAVNNHMFSQLHGMEYEYEFVQKTDCTAYMDGSNKPIPPAELGKQTEITEKEIQSEVASLLSQSQMVSQLSLKKGAVVMCTANLNMDAGICNGSQGVVIDFVADQEDKTGYAELPLVRFSNGVVMRIPIQYRHSVDYPMIAVGQIPLCLAWALTIHKIQGASMDMAEIDVGRSVFECGQTYVALSRIRSLNGLYLSSFHPQKIRANPKVVAFYDSIQRKPEQIEAEMKRMVEVGRTEHAVVAKPTTPPSPKSADGNPSPRKITIKRVKVPAPTTAIETRTLDLDFSQFEYQSEQATNDANAKTNININTKRIIF